MSIRHEYKGVHRKSWQLTGETLAGGVARAAQYESADGWDLVSFSVFHVPNNGSGEYHVDMVFRRKSPLKESTDR